MKRLSIAQYWEKLERHDRFYPWSESPEEYEASVEEARELFYLSRLSDDHAQLYTTYWTATYLHAALENGEVQDIDIPTDGIPEAA